MSEHDFEHEHGEQADPVPNDADAVALPDDQGVGEFLPADPPEHEPHPELPQAGEPAGAAGGWHHDPGADDDLRRWLDDQPPALEPPAGSDPMLADALVADAERDGADADELVGWVMARLGLPGAG